MVSDDYPRLMDMDSKKLALYTKTHIFNNPQDFKLESTQTWGWFLGVLLENKDEAVAFLEETLNKSHHAISKKSILESVDYIESLL